MTPILLESIFFKEPTQLAPFQLPPGGGAGGGESDGVSVARPRDARRLGGARARACRRHQGGTYDGGGSLVSGERIGILSPDTNEYSGG